MVAHKVETVEHVLAEGILTHNHLVGGHHNDARIGTLAMDAHTTPSHRGGCVADDGLCEYAVLGQLGQLLAHPVVVFQTGTDKDVFFWQYSGHAVEG